MLRYALRTRVMEFDELRDNIFRLGDKQEAGGPKIPQGTSSNRCNAGDA